MCRSWRDQSLYQILAKSSNPHQSYSDLYIWPTWCASLRDKFHQVWTRSTWFIRFYCWYIMSSCDLYGYLWPLDREHLYTSGVTWSVHQHHARDVSAIAEHSSVFLAKYLLRMRRIFGQNSDTAVEFDDFDVSVTDYVQLQNVINISVFFPLYTEYTRRKRSLQWLWAWLIDDWLIDWSLMNI